VFIRSAEQLRMAERIIKLFKLPSVAEFKKRLEDRVSRLNKLFNNKIWWPITKDDIDRIGTLGGLEIPWLNDSQ
jgi:hypothetical protein